MNSVNIGHPDFMANTVMTKTIKVQ